MQIQGNKEYAPSSEEPLCLSYSGFSESSLLLAPVLQPLFICTGSRLPGEQRGGVAADEHSDRSEWSPWPVLQLTVSFLARLYWAMLTLTVKSSRGVLKVPHYHLVALFVFNHYSKTINQY